MKALVSYRTSRILNILEHAIINESVSVSDICDFNKCSKTTVYDDLDFMFLS